MTQQDHAPHRRLALNLSTYNETETLSTSRPQDGQSVNACDTYLTPVYAYSKGAILTPHLQLVPICHLYNIHS